MRKLKMKTKILFIFYMIMLMSIITTPALADKPSETPGKGHINKNFQEKNNNSHDNGEIKSEKTDNQSADNPNDQFKVSTNNSSNEKINNNTNNNNNHGFNDVGYNFTARIFNGIAWDWCMDKVGNEDWCNAYLGEYKYDRIIMKWNAEWDRGNDENWLYPPYEAWENNQWNGKVPNGSGDVWHYKIVWVGPCGADGTPLENGGYCLWGQFEVISDHGTLDGVHEWLAHATPNGYGSYP
jgi:hypothetical protein